jgi:Transposase
MRKHRSYPVEFKRQVAQEYLAGETLHGLAKRHEINRNLVRIWVAKYEAGSFDNDVIAAEPASSRVVGWTRPSSKPISSGMLERAVGPGRPAHRSCLFRPSRLADQLRVPISGKPRNTVSNQSRTPRGFQNRTTIALGRSLTGSNRFDAKRIAWRCARSRQQHGP